MNSSPEYSGGTLVGVSIKRERMPLSAVIPAAFFGGDGDPSCGLSLYTPNGDGFSSIDLVATAADAEVLDRLEFAIGVLRAALGLDVKAAAAGDTSGGRCGDGALCRFL